MTSVDLKEISSKAQALQPWIIERRRELHKHPELSYQEKKTSAYLREQVKALGFEPSAPVAEGKYGFYTELKSKTNPDKYILLRADMDALPIQEENNVDFRSQNDGVGHLCGHDAHSTMLLGALNIVKDMRDKLPCSVRFVFQHAEEMDPGGAKDFVEAGLTKDVLGCYGLHVSPKVPSNQFGIVKGEAMAMVGSFHVTFKGRGGHGSAPQDTIDPVPAAAATILNLQTIVARRIPPIEPCVVSVTMIHAGTATNVIPGEVKIGGTIRTYNEARAPQLLQWFREIVETTAATYNCEVDIEAYFSYPPVINNPTAMEAYEEAIGTMFGAGAAIPFNKSMGAEDFAYFAREKPSAFLFLGALAPGQDFHPLHHPQFLPDENVLWKGAALLAAMPFVAPKYLS